MVAVIAVIVAFIVANLRQGKQPIPQSSPVGSAVISDNRQTYTSPYFSFQDTGGKWIFEKNRSNANTYIYDKYQATSLIAEIIFYVNQQPYFGNGFTRVLPVRIANGNSFEPTGVSDPCVTQYSPNEPHITKTIEFNGTSMICNAGDNQYSVVVGEVGGNYNLPMNQTSGIPLQLQISYKYDGVNPDSSSLLNVIRSFHTL